MNPSGAVVAFSMILAWSTNDLRTLLLQIMMMIYDGNSNDDGDDAPACETKYLQWFKST